MGNIKSLLKKIIFGKREDGTLSSRKFKNVLIKSKEILNQKQMKVCFNGDESKVLTIIEGHSLSKGFLPVNYTMLSLPQKLALVIWMKRKLDKDNEYSLRFDNKPFVFKEFGFNLPIRLNKSKDNEIVINVNHLHKCQGFEVLTSLMFSLEERALEKVEYDNKYSITNDKLYKKYPELSFDNEKVVEVCGEGVYKPTQWMVRAIVNNQLPYKKYVECRKKAIDILDNCSGYCSYESKYYPNVKRLMRVIESTEKRYMDFVSTQFEDFLTQSINSINDGTEYFI